MMDITLVIKYLILESIINYLIFKKLNSYWVNTASNDLLKYHFQRLSKDNLEKLTSLLKVKQ